MSRIGRMPITLPDGVTVTIDGHAVEVKGPKGTLKREFSPLIDIAQEDVSFMLPVIATSPMSAPCMV